MLQKVIESLVQILNQEGYTNIVVSDTIKHANFTDYEKRLYTKLVYGVVENKILYKKNNEKKDTLVSVLYKIDGTIELDSKVKTIGYYSFYGQSGLKELVIPEGIEKIEASAFTNCPSLLKIEIPKTVKSIGDSCFSDNTSSLEEILIKNKEDSITGAPWGAAKGMKVVQWKK